MLKLGSEDEEMKITLLQFLSINSQEKSNAVRRRQPLLTPHPPFFLSGSKLCDFALKLIKPFKCSIRRFWTVLDGFRRYQTVSDGIRRYQTLSDGIRRYQTGLYRRMKSFCSCFTDFFLIDGFTQS